MNRKYLMPLIIIIIIFTFLITSFSQKEKSPSTITDGVSNKQNENFQPDNQQFLLSGFPESVPLYNLEKILSSKYFVNDDLSSSYLYGGPVNYYNVVFKTSDSRTKLFSDYQNIFESVDLAETSESKLVGTIGQYEITVSQYSENSNDAYIQVFLPSDQYQKENRYFSNYPNLVTIDQSWIEKESSYGLLNQKNGEKEYTQYFVIDESQLSSDVLNNPFEFFYNKYAEENKDKDNFVKNDEVMMISWVQDNFEVSLTFSNDQAKIFLMMREPLSAN